jgi:hypothetical protein
MKILTRHFSYCDLLREGGSGIIAVQCVCAVEMIDSLAEVVKMRFSDFRSLAARTIRIFETHSLSKSGILQNNSSLN